MKTEEIPSYLNLGYLSPDCLADSFKDVVWQSSKSLAVVQFCVLSLGTEGYECRGGLGCTGVSHLVRERSSVYTEYTNT